MEGIIIGGIGALIFALVMLILNFYSQKQSKNK